MSSIKGTCMEMCPYVEIKMREKNKLLHPLEILNGTEKANFPKADFNKIVKCYTRSAAGTNLAQSNILRPPEILYKTIKYLLIDVINNKKYDYVIIYDYITDRLRAINQDVIIQSLQSEECVKLYEPIVKFHIYSDYKLCEEKISKYDPTLNRKQLLEYLKHLLVCYDEVDNKYKNSETQKFYTQRPLIEAIYILNNLNDIHPLFRYLTLPKQYKTEATKISYDIAINYRNGNYVQLFKLLKNLHMLSLCAISFQIPIMRRDAIHVMNIAYSCKNCTFPIKTFKSILYYNNINEAIDDCNHYGITIKNEDIVFNKNILIKNTAEVMPKKLTNLEKKLKNINISDILLYNKDTNIN